MQYPPKTVKYENKTTSTYIDQERAQEDPSADNSCCQNTLGCQYPASKTTNKIYANAPTDPINTLPTPKVKETRYRQRNPK